MSHPTLEQYTEQSLALGYDEVLVRDWPANHATPEHVHPFDAHVLVVRGGLKLTVDGKVHDLKPGDLFDVPRGTSHIEQYGPEGATFWAARRGG
jgi:mannose-6-phosphate isomerase-like protein (cupin superfamily)